MRRFSFWGFTHSRLSPAFRYGGLLRPHFLHSFYIEAHQFTHRVVFYLFSRYDVLLAGNPVENNDGGKGNVLFFCTYITVYQEMVFVHIGKLAREQLFIRDNNIIALVKPSHLSFERGKSRVFAHAIVDYQHGSGIGGKPGCHRIFIEAGLGAGGGQEIKA